MSTFFHDRINVLGAPATACTTGEERGYSEAIGDCLEIGEDADAMVDELIECLEEMLNGNFLRLERFAEEARLLISRIKQRRNA